MLFVAECKISLQLGLENPLTLLTLDALHIQNPSNTAIDDALLVFLLLIAVFGAAKLPERTSLGWGAREREPFWRLSPPYSALDPP